MTINFDNLKTLLTDSPKARVAVVWPSDESTRGALAKALADDLVSLTLIGASDEAKSDPALMQYLGKVQIVEAANPDEAALKAVTLARQAKADVIMKGLINTDNMLRCVLNKEQGIMLPGEVLTHVTCARIPAYGRLLIFTDAAVLPYPTDAQRTAQLRYVISIARRLGIAAPKVALVHCSEKTDERHFHFTKHYEELRLMAAHGLFGPCVVDGPLDVKVACSKAAMEKKRLSSPLQGESDALVFPDIIAANTFYKTITLWADADTAAIAMGACVPLVVPSRGDSPTSKYHSLLLAACVADRAVADTPSQPY